MAETVYIKDLTIAGTQVEGESSVKSMDREGTIECSSYHHRVSLPYDPYQSGPTGRKEHSLITISKKIDRSTPALLKALCAGERVDEATFMFFRPSRDSTSGEERFYSVKVGDGRVMSVEQLSEDSIVAGEKAPPMMEKVAFSFTVIEWTYEAEGITHVDQRVGMR